MAATERGIKVSQLAKEEDWNMDDKMQVEQLARICHEANRAYCQSIGDDSQPTWDAAPEWQRESAIKGVEFHLAAHARNERLSPSASHDSWLEEKRQAGWKFGEVKDADKKEHPCFVPYDELPLAQRRKDYLFGAVVESLATAS